MCIFLDALFEDMNDTAKFRKTPLSLFMRLGEGEIREVDILFLSRKTA
jgi:hypothetical protein